VVVLSQGADLAAFYDPDRREGDGAPAGARLRLLFVGADFDRKGGRLLLQAVPALAGRVELDVVTRAPVGPVPEHVRVHVDLGHDDPELARLFRAADVFVLPTLSDAAPLVLGEALAAGLPVVATRVGAVPELAVDGETGLLVPPGDADALVAALRTLVDDAPLRRALGRRARALAVERYDADANNRGVLDVLRAVTARPAQELPS
jgi:glycosyltransferase involved in cell wall biosynthesis